MSRRKRKIFYVLQEEPQKCEYCGRIAELRPYGKNGANICFKCGMENIKTTEAEFGKRIAGVDTVVVVNKG
jgi:hypothetical protein